MDFTKFKGIIFDMDGTLVNSSHVWSDIDRKFLQKRGLSVPDDYYKKVSAMDFQRAAEYTIKRFNLDEKPSDIIEEWTGYAENEYANNVFIKDNVDEFLDYIKSHGVKIALATASNERLYTAVLKNNGIYNMFDFFASTSQVSRGKGFPDVYEFACSNIELQPNECAVFEDIIEGVRGANAGKFTSIACLDDHYSDDWEAMKSEADFYFRNYSSLFKEKIYI